jgi:AGZA family xanthine/uracil permease-like MFS transporter
MHGCAGTLLSMTHFINNYVPGFLNEKREFPRQTIAYCVDGVATMAGALMGTSPVAVFIESAAGIREGGRTGITALVVAFYFFIALFFEPILGEEPPPGSYPLLPSCRSLLE